MKAIPIQVHVGQQPTQAYFDNCKSYGDGEKPFVGIWTSTFNPEIGSDWIRVNNTFTNFRFVKPNSEAWKINCSPERILVIDSEKSFQRIAKKYKWKRSGFRYTMDWNKVAQDYDGVWLTENGLKELCDRSRNYHGEPNLVGWDCESIVWFRWCFDKIEAFSVKEYVKELV